MAVIFRDTFTDIDNVSLSNHTTDSGHAWGGYPDYFYITDNQVAQNGNGRPMTPSLIDDNFRVSMDIYVEVSNAGEHALHFRDIADGAGNYGKNYCSFIFDKGDLILRKTLSNSHTVVAQTSKQFSYPLSAKLSVEVSGTNVKCYLDSELIFKDVITDNQTGMRCGIGVWGTNQQSRFDNFLIEELTTNGEVGSAAFDTRNILYSSDSVIADIQQAIYSVNSLQTDSRQVIYDDGSTGNDTFIQVYQADAFAVDSAQVIKQTAAVIFDTLQNITDSGTTGSRSFDLKMGIYSESNTTADTAQRLFTTASNITDLQQSIYEAGQSTGDVHLVIYADSPEIHDLKHIIYSNDSVLMDTEQVLFDETLSLIGQINLTGSRQLHIHLAGKRIVEINVTGKQVAEINLKGRLKH